jgi:hypothetical protein
VLDVVRFGERGRLLAFGPHASAVAHCEGFTLHPVEQAASAADVERSSAVVDRDLLPTGIAQGRFGGAG